MSEPRAPRAGRPVCGQPACAGPVSWRPGEGARSRLELGPVWPEAQPFLAVGSRQLESPAWAFVPLLSRREIALQSQRPSELALSSQQGRRCLAEGSLGASSSREGLTRASPCRVPGVLQACGSSVCGFLATQYPVCKFPPLVCKFITLSREKAATLPFH